MPRVFRYSFWAEKCLKDGTGLKKTILNILSQSVRAGQNTRSIRTRGVGTRTRTRVGTDTR